MLKWIPLFFLALLVVLAATNWPKVQSGWLATKKFFREVRVEMQKVTWPSQNDIIGSTIVVMVAVVALTAIITAWDHILSFVLQLVLKKGA
jgi:preprotein translocase subunit SecE